MQIRKLVVPALVLGAAALAAPASAQTVLPLSFEVRGGVVLPQGDFDDGANTGFIVGGTVHYRVAPIASIFAGFEHAKFGIDDDSDFGDVDADITDQGFRLGARFDVPLAGMTGISPWIEGGATFNKTSINFSDDDASVGVDSDRSVGFEVGAGLAFNVAPKISITPGVRYRSHKAEFDFDGGSEEFDVNYFAIDLGVHIRL